MKKLLQRICRWIRAGQAPGVPYTDRYGNPIIYGNERR